MQLLSETKQARSILRQAPKLCNVRTSERCPHPSATCRRCKSLPECSLRNYQNNVFGQQYLQTGLNLYVGLNQNLLNTNQSEITEPPTCGVACIGARRSNRYHFYYDGCFYANPVPTGYSLVIAATLQFQQGEII